MVNFNTGLVVFDVTNPALPVPVLGTFTNSNVQKMTRLAISGNIAYIVGHEGHYLAAVDISNPASMTYLGRSLDLPLP